MHGTRIFGMLLLLTFAALHGHTQQPTATPVPVWKPAPAWAIAPWTRAANAPVIRPDAAATFDDPITHAPVHWEALHTFNPAAVVRDGKVYVLYRAEDDSGALEIGGHVSRLGLAISDDGVHFTQRPQPVFFADNDEQRSREVPGGVEDPRIVERPEGGYVMMYTQWSRERASYSIGVATSDDLAHWSKHGPAFAGALGGRYDELKYKSAGVVTELRADGHGGRRLVAAKIHGRYWMYWGEIQVGLAWSRDLVHWTPVEVAPGVTRVLLEARAGHADSAFPETGPPPVLTRRGIVMIYNAKNAVGANDKRAAGANSKDAGTAAASGGDPRLAAGSYSVEEALFAADDPARMLARTDDPVFRPELAFERSGQYAAGTTFAEGLVAFHGRWFLYYGCADSFVGVATAPLRSDEMPPDRPQ